MREIKFRAWNKEKKVMVGSFAHIGKGGRMYTIHHEGEEPEYEIMQYTGLKDKNGKEIYEGDIVGIKKQSQWFVAKVEYQTRWARFVGVVISSNKGNKNVTLNNTTESIEILGNIYEDSELLDKLSKKNNG